mgnify:CR=1 FL=1
MSDGRIPVPTKHAPKLKSYQMSSPDKPETLLLVEEGEEPNAADAYIRSSVFVPAVR